MLVDQLKRQHKAQAVASSNQSSLKALHYTALDAYSFANDEFSIWLDSIAARTGAEKIDLAIPQRNGLFPVANNSQHPGRLEDPCALSQIDAYKQVGREERNRELDSLTIFPTPNGLVGWKKCFDVTDAELLESRLFVLGSGIDGVPMPLTRGTNDCGTEN